MTTTTTTQPTFAEVIKMMTEQIEWNKQEIALQMSKSHSFVGANKISVRDKRIAELRADTRRIENNIDHMKLGRELA
tara:strand:+ start:221 stop:451 length:231 start_codon:yes stop_codon:yes gene_type:complete